MKGRPPKTTAKHKAEGTYNATKHRDRLTYPTLEAIPKPPDYFTEWQIDKWNFTCRLLKDDGLLSDRYLSVLELLCNIWKRWWEAKQNVDIVGLTFETDSGQTKQNPAVAIEKEMMSLWLRTLQDFGYTPRSATSIKSPGGDDDNDPLAELLNGKRTN